MISVYDMVENIVGKGENAGDQHFLLYPQCFQNVCFSGSLIVGIVWEKVICINRLSSKILHFFFSAAIDISSVMSVDAFVTKCGIRMMSTLHTSTAVQGKIHLSPSETLTAEYEMPQKRMEVFDFK